MRTMFLQTFFAATLLGFSQLGGASEDFCADNIVIVLDASGSMNEWFGAQTKMAAAKTALKQVLAKVPTSTRIGLLVFSGSNVRDEWLYPLQSRVDSALSDAINLPEPGGGTPLGKYIKIGADKLIEQRAKQLNYGTYKLLIVTDGAADDQALVERYTSEVMARGIRVEVIGVLMRQEHILARKVHAYRNANDSSALSRALNEAVAEISSDANDQVAKDDFAFLKPLPGETVWPLLQSMTAYRNQPIGSAAASVKQTPVKFEAPRPAAPTPTVLPPQITAQPALRPVFGIFLFGFLLIVSWMLAITIRRKA